MSRPLFEKGLPEAGETRKPVQAAGQPRLRVPQRNQVEFREAALEELLEADHPARVVWSAVCSLNLSHWLKRIKAVEGNVGRDATDPRLLVALWVYATLDAVGSAREIERLCRQNVVYQWLCGGVSVNHHLLSDFRSQQAGAWDELLTQIVGALLAEELVTMKEVAQDGMRVRASVGKSSFHRRPSLKSCLKRARQQLETLRQLADDAPDELTARQRAARERAATERAARLEEALRQCEHLDEQRQKQAKKSGREAQEPRASSTDPEARTMQFSDGGYRPAYNVQFATDTSSGVIVGVDTVNVGNDAQQLPPMLEQLERRYGVRPERALVDGGFASLDSIEQAAARQCEVYAPLKDESKQLEAGKDPYAPKPGDSPALADWRARMGTALGKLKYRFRAQTAEWVNALARNRGLQQMPVRGRDKCRIVAVLYAIAHNVMTVARLHREQLVS
jgi:transposase